MPADSDANAVNQEGPGSSPAPDGDAPAKEHHRIRSVLSWVTLVLACLLAVLSVVAIYARNEVLNTDAFVATVGPLARSQAIQEAVATKVADKVNSEVNFDQQLNHYLPKKLDFLSAPVASAAQTAVYQVTLRIVQSRQFQTLWLRAVRDSHVQVVDLLTGRSEGAFSSSNGVVSVDLGTVETQVKQQLVHAGLGFVAKVPNYHAPALVLFKSNQLLRLQRLARLLNRLALALPVLTLLLFAGTVALNRDRRRGVMRSGAGLAISMAAVLVLAAVGRNLYLGSEVRTNTTSAEAAVIDAVSALLLREVRVVMVGAAVVAVLAFVVGSARVRSWLGGHWPSWISEGPFHDFLARFRKPLQWIVLTLGLARIVTSEYPTVLGVLVTLIVTLVVIGLIGLVASSRPRLADGSGRGQVPAG